jgi:hypothetical protein
MIVMTNSNGFIQATSPGALAIAVNP